MALPNNLNSDTTYMVTGAFINSILDEIRRNKIVVEESSGLLIKEVGPNGTVLGLDTATC